MQRNFRFQLLIGPDFFLRNVVRQKRLHLVVGVVVVVDVVVVVGSSSGSNFENIQSIDLDSQKIPS